MILATTPRWFYNGIEFRRQMSPHIRLRRWNAEQRRKDVGREVLIENEDSTMNSTLLQILRIFLHNNAEYNANYCL